MLLESHWQLLLVEKKTVLKTCTMAKIHPLQPEVKYGNTGMRSMSDIHACNFISFGGPW